MPTNDDDLDFFGGFNLEFEELGEHAVLRQLSVGNFDPARRDMAYNWLDHKRREAAQATARLAERAENRAERAEGRAERAEDAAKRAETRAKWALAISILAIVATFIVAFVTPHIR
jgi:hypothetical protein